METFFEINLPYGLARNKQGQWMLFNKQFLPIGFHTFTSSQSLPYLPLYQSYELTESFIQEIAVNEESIEKDAYGTINRFFLYNELSNPMRSSNFNSSLWVNYFAKIHKLSKLILSE